MGAGHAHPHDRDDGHGDGLGHRHAHGPRRLDERRRLVAALVLTSVILVAEVAGGLWSRSLALLSDAGHMLSDAGAQVLSLVALAIAARPADARRTYGYYRIEILAALVNGVTLIVLAAWIIWSGWRRLQSGPPAVDLRVMTSIAGVGLAANLGGAWLLRGAHSLNVKGAYLHVLTDTLSSLAVLLGGLVMWLGGGLWAIDPILSMCIGLFITWSAWRLVREAVDVLLEAVPKGVDLHGVRAALGRVHGVEDIHDLHIWTITSGMRALSAHLVVSPAALAGADRMLAEIRDVLGRDYHISHTTIQLETAKLTGDEACAGCPPLPGGPASPASPGASG